MSTTSQNETILIVDDSLDALSALAGLLEEEGFTVETAPDGATALVVAGRGVPDVILLDLQMPRMDGYEVLSALKAEPRTADCSVIVVSASAAEADIVRALERGAIDYVTKPYAIEILLARLGAVLRSRREKEAVWRLGEDLRNAQDELARVRRSAALGAIAAGLAHEINNPAAFVVTDLHEVRELAADVADAGDVEHAEAIAALVDEALSGMHRIRDVVRDLSVFASVLDRRSIPSIAELDLAAVVRGRIERMPEGARVTVQGADCPASIAPGLGGEDELDALVGLLVRHAIAAYGMDREYLLEVGRDDQAVCVSIRAAMSDAGERLEVMPDAALTLLIARELAERFGGGVEPTPGTHGFTLRLPPARPRVRASR